MPCFFPDWPLLDTIIPYMKARLARKFAEPRSTFYTAIDGSSGEILGKFCMTLETGEEVVDRKMTNLGGDFKPPPGFNWGFSGEVIAGLKKLDEFMIGKRHYNM